jgi:hypothetical protein
MYFMILRFRSATDVKMPRGNVALDLGEPELDLIQPRRVRGREVQLHRAMLGEELPHRLRLVGREIVENDVDLAPRRLRRDDSVRNVRKSALVCRAAVCPITSPVWVFSAA